MKGDLNYKLRVVRNSYRLKAFLSAFLAVPYIEDCRNLPGHPARFEFLGVINILDRLITRLADDLGSLAFDDLPED